eukprot:c23315_g1_i1 orf=382-1932(-)
MVLCRNSELSPRTKLHSAVLAICVLLLAVGVYALDQDAVMASSSKTQVREQGNKELQSQEVHKTEEIPGPEPKSKILNPKSFKRSRLHGSSSLVQAMQEQIETAKKLASFARLDKRPRLFRELQLRIKESEQAIGASVWDADLPKSAPEKMRALRRVVSRATERHNKCEDTVRRLQSSVLVNEDKVLALKEENKFLGRLAARTMPKGFHCLALQLTIQYYNQLGGGLAFADETKLDDSGLWHYVVYTENILAATAIVNSTVYFAKEPHRHVFHVLTDSLNQAAMQMWFQGNMPGNVVVEVKNLERSNIFQISWGPHEQTRKYLKPVISRAHLKQEDLGSVKRLGLYFDLSEMFPKLDKVMVMDEDIVMRKDLTHLWEVNLHNNVIGAVRSCTTSSDLNDALGWWSCINMVDLAEWRRQGLTEMYKQSILTLEEDLWDELTILHNNSTHMLDDSSSYVLDLDDTPSEFENGTQHAVAIHYRGYAKPWLGMGMSRHRSLWTRFVNYESPLLQACNINK